MTGLQSYVLSKKYTEQSLNGVGALKGAPCTIKSTTETDEGTIVVFEWTGTDGSTETKAITIKKGVSITDIEINNNKHLICTMSDGSTIDAGEVPNIKGDTGFSPTIEENPNNTDEIYKLDITNESSTFTTPNLKGPSGGLDPDKYYNKTQVDAFIEPLDKAKHTHNNKETVLDKLTTNATGDTLLFNGQEISSVEIDDTTTTAADKVWSAKKTNDTIDAIKAWVDSDKSLAIKTALYNNNTLTFYKKPNATIDDTADFSINLPEEQFLDQTKTTFINNFVWSKELYPNSTNPNLDNQPVLVLGVKGDTDVVYSFVSMNELVKIYKASTTISTVTLVIEDTTNTISAEVNISADNGNLLKVGTDGGLYAKVTVDNTLSDTSENPVQNKIINIALNNKADLSDIPTELPANGGNADTVDGKHANDFSQIITFNTSTDTKTAIGIPYKTTIYWCQAWTDYPTGTGITDGQGVIIAVNYKSTSDGNTWCRQFYIAPSGNAKIIYQRIISGTGVGNWINIADGGNAATVNGYTVNANVPEGFSPIGQNTENKTYTYEDSDGVEITYTGSNTSEVFNNYANNMAAGVYSHAEGYQTKALESYTHSEGVNTLAIGQGSHAEGGNLEQDNYGNIKFEKPRDVVINSTLIIVEGSQAFGLNSHAEGCSTLAYGKNSHTEGYHTVAAANESHAEGCGCEANKSFSHAEGYETKANGNGSHAEGRATIANGTYSHAEGYNTTVSGSYSHAEGSTTTASGSYSHAEGYNTTSSNSVSHAQGHYNAAMTTGGNNSNTTGTAFVIGNGTSSSALSNAFSVQFNGTVKAKSTITASTTADYAEFFEWLDGNPDDEDRVGYFVTLDGDKIRIATAADDYILGVVSGEPFVLGNGDCDTWNGMYLHDEFRRTIYEPAPKMIEILDSEGNPTGEYEEVEGEFEGTRPKLNPEYDHTQPYISRLDRKEWAPVGMLGVLAVRHDGTAQVNGYVTVNANGIATACEKNTENAYRVIKSNTDSVVEIIFR